MIKIRFTFFITELAYYYIINRQVQIQKVTIEEKMLPSMLINHFY